MVGRSEQRKLERLISEVARGQRTLAGVTDSKMREAVRLALRLHQDAPAIPNDYTRRRMRARVMAGLRPHRPTLRDNAGAALWHLGRPAPYIVRCVAITGIVLGAGMGATLASSDSVPDDALYSVKLATESVRLALAGAPQDRAAVELSIAEHRLVEAEKLASSGRTSEALVASAIFSEHIASAAAELAPEADSETVGAQLESSFNAQRERAQSLAILLSLDERSAKGGEVLAMIAAPTMAPGRTQVERVAETAASVAFGLAGAADAAAEQASAFTATPRPTTATTRPGVTANPRASAAAKATRHAADKARAAAEKLKKTLREREQKHQSERDRD